MPAVGRRRHHASAGGVLLVDGEGEGAQPLPRQFAAALGLGLFELASDGGGAAFHAEAPRQHAVRAQTGLQAFSDAFKLRGD